MNSQKNSRKIISGLALLIFVLLVISMFTNKDDDMDAGITSSVPETSEMLDKKEDELTTLMMEVEKITGTPNEIEDKVSAGIDNDKIIYLKGKAVSGRDIPSELLKKISPLMINQGFEIIHKDQLGGQAQIGEENYDNGEIQCSLMSGIFAQGFNDSTSSFSLNCAYSKNSAPTYMEAFELEID